MPRAHANGIDLEWEEFGDADDPPLLLIMGLGAQMIAWDDDFCGLIAARGFRVVRFDNRDTGLSTKIEGGPAPDVLAAITGDTTSASYTLDDMADDAAALLDALGITSAHVVGASMGGMIAQTLAIRHPHKVQTLTSIMSTTGALDVGQPDPAAVALLLEPPPLDRAGFIEHSVGASRVLASPGFPFDDDLERARAARSYDRSFHPAGVGRQLLAIVASGDRTPALRTLQVPTLVIHGEGDRLVTPSGGRATAAAVPGARLLMIPGMGHDLPRQAWEPIADAIGELVATTREPV
jgi:pimeloyl-ACP methyl ester carboxylesterase